MIAKVKKIITLKTITTSLDYSNVLTLIDKAIKDQAPTYIDTSNTMIISEACINNKFNKALMVFDHIIPDAVPLVWYMRLISANIKDPCYGPELTRRIMEKYATNTKIMIIGPNPETIHSYENIHHTKSIWITATTNPITSQDMASFISKIQYEEPAIIFLALGCPRQHYFAQKLKPHLKKGVVIGVGSSFDILSNKFPMIPSHIRRIGLGWFYRTIHEPKRLIPRYLYYNTLFIVLAILYYVPNLIQNRNKSL